MKLLRTAERISALHPCDNFVYQRSVLAYEHASRMLSGNVLEIGTGSGYGIRLIAPRASEFWTIDKYPVEIDYMYHSNTRFILKQVPGLSRLPHDYFDYVICFQLIEHIEDDSLLLREIAQVLKPSGRLLISTPNLQRSLTSNPWHVREYTHDEFDVLLSQSFEIVDSLGIFGNGKVERYYMHNKCSVERILSVDFLKLHKYLPRQLLRFPYDVCNQLNRLFLFNRHRDLTENIETGDYYLKEVDKDCFDLFYVARPRVNTYSAACDNL